MNNKVILAIMDGIGISNQKYGNAVKMAKPKFLKKAMKIFPHTELICSGEKVGLPNGQMGNSEVGHLNIGAGRIVYQDLLTIDKSIQNGSFFRNSKLCKMFNEIAECKKTLHILGILSNGGVHGSIEHIKALLKMSKNKNFENVLIHIITDGRDTLPNIADKFIEQLQNYINEIKVGKIVSVVGRYYAMDRESNYDRTKIAYDSIVLAKGEKTTDIISTVKAKISSGETDEFIKPIVLNNYKGFKKGDVCIFTNFRADRARQLSYAISIKNFNKFNTKNNYKLYTMTCYDKNLNEEGVQYIFDLKNVKNNLTEVVTKNGGNVLKIAETTKYAHVTYFFNGMKEIAYKNEDRILHESDKIASFDLKPKMKAIEITKSTIEAINSNKYDLIVLNLANGDMVGHTGNLKATIKAVKSVDKALKLIYKNRRNYKLIITADHGNAELMRNKQGQIITSHTLNNVPFIICDKSYKLRNGEFSLCNIAPTILEILKIDKPKEMDENSLLFQ